MDQMPSKVSFQPKLFYDSVMKDTFPADCMSSFWAALVENTREKKNQKCQVNSILSDAYFICKPLLNHWKSNFPFQNPTKILLQPHGPLGSAILQGNVPLRDWHQANATTVPLHRADVGASGCQSVPA